MILLPSNQRKNYTYCIFHASSSFLFNKFSYFYFSFISFVTIYLCYQCNTKEVHIYSKYIEITH
jgi:hypothetical protein